MTDPQNHSDQIPFSIRVVDPSDYVAVAPRIRREAPGQATADQEFVFDPQLEEPVADDLSWFLDEKPNGMQIDRATGRVTWTPRAADVGKFFDVTIRVANSVGAGSLFSFRLEVVGTNQVPVFDLVFPSRWNVHTPLDIPLSGHDPEGHAIQFSLDPVGQGSLPAGFELTADNHIHWEEPDAGTINFLVTVSEVHDPSSKTTRNISIRIDDAEMNLRPLIGSVPNGAMASAGIVNSYTIVATDPDHTGQLLYAIESGQSGNLQFADPHTGVLTWTPTPGEAGIHSITVRVTDMDGSGESTFATFDLEVISNLPPVIRSSDTVKAIVGDYMVFQIDANDPEGTARDLRLWARHADREYGHSSDRRLHRVASARRDS